MSKLHKEIDRLRLKNARATIMPCSTIAAATSNNPKMRRSGYVKGRLSILDACTGEEVVGLDFNRVPMPKHVNPCITIEDEWEPING